MYVGKILNPKLLLMTHLKMHKLLTDAERLFLFLDDLYKRLEPGEEKAQVRQNPEGFAWDDVASLQSQSLQPIPGWCHFS